MELEQDELELDDDYIVDHNESEDEDDNDNEGAIYWWNVYNIVKKFSLLTWTNIFTNVMHLYL